MSGQQQPRSEAPGHLRTARLIRILRLDDILRERGGASAKELCTELSVSIRTLQRDIEMLRGAGDKLDYSGKEKVYRVSEHGSLAAELLTAREFAGILAALEGLVPSKGSDFEAARRAIAAKLRDFLGKELPSALPQIEGIMEEFKQELRCHANCVTTGGWSSLQSIRGLRRRVKASLRTDPTRRPDPTRDVHRRV